MADPFSGEVFFTDGETAWVRHDGIDDALLTPTPATRLVDVNLDPTFPSAPRFRAVDLLAHPEFIERFRPRVGSTTLAPVWVAAGKRAAYVADGGDLSRSVHFAAGIAVCRVPAALSPASTVPRQVRQAVGSWPRRRGDPRTADVDAAQAKLMMRPSAFRAGPARVAAWKWLPPQRMPYSARIRARSRR